VIDIKRQGKTDSHLSDNTTNFDDIKVGDLVRHKVGTGPLLMIIAVGRTSEIKCRYFNHVSGEFCTIDLWKEEVRKIEKRDENLDETPIF